MITFIITFTLVVYNPLAVPPTKCSQGELNDPMCTTEKKNKAYPHLWHPKEQHIRQAPWPQTFYLCNTLTHPSSSSTPGGSPQHIQGKVYTNHFAPIIIQQVTPTTILQPKTSHKYSRHQHYTTCISV